MPIIPLAGTSAPKGSYVPLGTARLTTSTNTISFDNIPQGYQDLCLTGSVRLDFDGTFPALSIYSQSASSANFSQTVLRGTGSSNDSFRLLTSTPTFGVWFPFGSGMPGTYSPAGIFGSIKVDYLNYSSTTLPKTILSRSAADANGTGVTTLNATLLNVTTPFTALVLSSQGNMVPGTTISLYGIRSVNQ